MPSVPYTFAGQTGPIPLTELDQNFANVKAFATTAGTVTASAQANITSVGTLTSLAVTGNINGANLIVGTVYGTLSSATEANITSVGTLEGLAVSGSISATANITANRMSATLVGGLLTTAEQINITQVGNLVSLTVTGNTTSGNFNTAGRVSASGNIDGGNLRTAGLISATGNVTGGNIISLGILSASGNVNSGNLNTTNIVTTGNVTVAGNLTVQGTTITVDSQTLNINDKDIVVANNQSTSANIDGAGLLAGNPTVSYLRYSHANAGWGTGNNFNVGGNLSVSGTAAVTGVLTAPTAANGTSNTQVATTEFVAYNGVPAGAIIIWSGSEGAIPSGWYLCDGTNGTPDLTDRFIIGAGGAYAVDDTGGSANAIVVTHSHTATFAGDALPAHSHTVVANPGGSSGAFGGGTSSSATTLTTSSVSAGTPTGTITIDDEGSSGTDANLPPYYALCYIMKA